MTRPDNFRRFRSAYSDQRDPGDARAPWPDPRLTGIEDYAPFAHEFAGCSFGGGLYRVHDAQTGPHASSLIHHAFPEYAGRVSPFGYDWLGRQFAVDSGRVVDGQPQVLLIEPGTGEALEIPESFVGLHDDELVDHPEAALASDFFEAWAKGNRDALPLTPRQCVGYRIPLFLGGDDIVANLELSDLEVYWSVCGQLRQALER